MRIAPRPGNTHAIGLARNFGDLYTPSPLDNFSLIEILPTQYYNLFVANLNEIWVKVYPNESVDVTVTAPGISAN